MVFTKNIDRRPFDFSTAICHLRCSSRFRLCYLPNLSVLLSFQLGGTVGDIEGMPYIEAFRQFQFRVGRDNFCVVHVSLIPEVISVLIKFLVLDLAYDDQY